MGFPGRFEFNEVAVECMWRTHHCHLRRAGRARRPHLSNANLCALPDIHWIDKALSTKLSTTCLQEEELTSSTLIHYLISERWECVGDELYELQRSPIVVVLTLEII